VLFEMFFQVLNQVLLLFCLQRYAFPLKKKTKMGVNIIKGGKMTLI